MHMTTQESTQELRERIEKLQKSGMHLAARALERELAFREKNAA